MAQNKEEISHPVEVESDESDSDIEPTIRQFKVILLGDGAVGKTSICQRFTDDQFSHTYKQTIGLDFFLKRIVLPGDIHVALQVWDIGGQTLGSKMLTRYIAGAHAVIFTYDITNYQTFQNLEDWLRIVVKAQEANGPKQDSLQNEIVPYMALFGNKTDLSHMRSVRMAKHTGFAGENGMSDFLMSAKSGDQVSSAFYRVAADLAGVVLTKPDVQVRTKVVKAELVNHQKDDPLVHEPAHAKIEDRSVDKSRRRVQNRCVIQ